MVQPRPVPGDTHKCLRKRLRALPPVRSSLVGEQSQNACVMLKPAGQTRLGQPREVRHRFLPIVSANRVSSQREIMGVIVSLVIFRSSLSDDEVLARFEARADRYQSVPGLVEKLYLRYQETGEFGAIYVWDSEESLARFRDSELSQTIPQAYQVDGWPRTEVADVILVVRPEVDAEARVTL